MTARGAGAVGAGAALIGTAAAVSLSGSVVPGWPSASPTVIGLWLIDVVSAIPVGDPLFRAAAAAASLATVTAALAAWMLARLGHGPTVAAGTTLAIGLLSYGGGVSSADLPASLAAVLTTAATSAAFRLDWPPVLRTSLSAVLLLVAGVLEPAAFAVLPLVVIHAVEGSTAARALAGAFGSLTGAWWSGEGLAGAAAGIRLNALVQPWLWPSMMTMVSGAVAPIWGRPAATTAVVGTATMAALMVAGHQASALAVFPTMLLAAGVESLPTLTSRTRGMLAITLLAVSIGEVWRRPVPETWRLLAWRDAVERALPAGTRITTGNAAAAALGGPLFQDRPSRLTLALDTRGAGVDDPGPQHLLEDLAALATSTGGQLVHVPVTYANVADFVARLPERTIVGVAISGADRDIPRDDVRSVLAQLGHQAPPSASTVVAIGVVGRRPGTGMIRDDGRLHVLIGEPLAVDGQRSPTDVELRATSDGVSVYLRGRALAAGRRWVVIALRPGGPLIDAMADSGDEASWPIRLPGLDVWRRSP